MINGLHDTIGTERGKSMENVSATTAPRNRLLWRKKGFLAGWSEMSEGVGNRAHYSGLIKMMRECIRDDGDSPENYEFRIDTAPPVEWVIGEIIDGASTDTKGESNETVQTKNEK